MRSSPAWTSGLPLVHASTSRCGPEAMIEYSVTGRQHRANGTDAGVMATLSTIAGDLTDGGTTLTRRNHS